MEIEDGLATAPASAGVGEPSPAPFFSLEDYAKRYSGSTRVAQLLFGDGLATAPAPAPASASASPALICQNFDLEAYAAQYSGRTLVARLLFIARQCGNEQMQLDALRLAYVGALKGKDTGLHRIIANLIAGRLGLHYAVDKAWSDAVDKSWSDAVDKVYSDAVERRSLTNVITRESIRVGYSELGDLQYARSLLSDALKSYTMAQDYCTTSSHFIQMYIKGILVCIELNQLSDVLSYVRKAENTPDGMDLVTISKLRAAAGLAYMRKNEFGLAAEKFVEIGSELRSNYSEMISQEDVAVYGVLCALASFNRKELKTKVIENSSFKTFMKLVPEVRELVNDFYASRISSFLESLEKLKPKLVLDIYLHDCLETLYKDISENVTKLDTDTTETIRFGLVVALEQKALWQDGVYFGDELASINSLQGAEAGMRFKLVCEAILAMQADRPKDALECMNHVVVLEPNMSSAERALFFVSALSATLCSKKSIYNLKMESSRGKSEAELEMLVTYMEKVKMEFQQASVSQIGLIDKYLMPNSAGEPAVSYLRLKGLIRELVAHVDATELNHYRALSSYMAALEKAEQQLCPSNSETIKAVLDLCIFLESGMDDPKSAYRCAKKALDEADPLLQGSARDPDTMFSKYLWNILSDLVRRLSKRLTGYEDLVPIKPCSKDRLETYSPEPECRHCKSGGSDTSMLALPSNYVHPILSEVDAYKLIVNEEQDEQQDKPVDNDYLFGWVHHQRLRWLGPPASGQ